MNTRKSCHLFLHTLKIAVFNPATSQIKFAAPFPDEYLPRLTGISSHRSGVSCGIDDDYRIVVFIHYSGGGLLNGRHCLLVFLYTWRTGEWERLIDYNPGRSQIGLPPGTDEFEDIMFVMEDMTACSQKLLNGCWHWLTHQYDEERIDNLYVRFMVLSFDFERKSLGLIRGPPCKTSHRADVFVLQDHLAVIVTPDPAYNPLLQIWMKMKGPKTIWTNIYSVDSIYPPIYFHSSILYGVDYYQVQEEPELIRIKSLTLLIYPIHLKPGKLTTFDDKGDHQVAEEEEDSNQIPLSVAGISIFRPTLERLPDSTQCKVDCAKSFLELKSDSIVKSFKQIREIPFVFKHAMLLVNKSEIVLASMASFEAGCSHNLFVGWATNPKNFILFTERCQFGTLARMLQPDASPKLVKATISRRIPIAEKELAATHTADLMTVQPFMQVQVKCFWVYMDFEGPSHRRSTKSILARVAPLKLVLVHGSAVTTQHLKHVCLNASILNMEGFQLDDDDDDDDVTNDDEDSLKIR